MNDRSHPLAYSIPVVNLIEESDNEVNKELEAESNENESYSEISESDGENNSKSDGDLQFSSIKEFQKLREMSSRGEDVGPMQGYFTQFGNSSKSSSTGQIIGNKDRKKREKGQRSFGWKKKRRFTKKSSAARTKPGVLTSNLASHSSSLSSIRNSHTTNNNLSSSLKTSDPAQSQVKKESTPRNAKMPSMKKSR